DLIVLAPAAPVPEFLAGLGDRALIDLDVHLQRFLGSRGAGKPPPSRAILRRSTVFIQAGGTGRFTSDARLAPISARLRAKSHREGIMKRILLGLALATFTMSTLPAKAGDIVDEWASVKAPPPPALKPVTVDPKTT